MFQLHDRVRIAETSEYYKEDSKHNPSDQIGVIQKIGPSTEQLPLTVLWKQGAVNSYSAVDLLHAENENSTATDAVNRPKQYKIFEGIEAEDIMELVAKSKLVVHLSPWEVYCFMNILKRRLQNLAEETLEEK